MHIYEKAAYYSRVVNLQCTRVVAGRMLKPNLPSLVFYRSTFTNQNIISHIHEELLQFLRIPYSEHTFPQPLLSSDSDRTVNFTHNSCVPAGV